MWKLLKQTIRKVICDDFGVLVLVSPCHAFINTNKISIYPSIFLFNYLPSIYISIYTFYLSTHLQIYLTFYRPIDQCNQYICILSIYQSFFNLSILSIHLSLYLFSYRYNINLSIYLYYQSIYLIYIYQSIFLFIYLSIFISIHLSYLSAQLYIYLAIYLFCWHTIVRIVVILPVITPMYVLMEI